jgi:hypothetical protein
MIRVRILILIALISGGCNAPANARADRAEARADRADARIRAACIDAAAHITGTLAALDTNPALGMALAARDAALIPLCGGDARATRAAFRRDAASARRALLSLQRVWCPTCVQGGVQ